MQMKYSVTNGPTVNRPDTLPASVLEMKYEGIFVEFLHPGKSGLKNRVALRINFQGLYLKEYKGVLLTMKPDFARETMETIGPLWKGNLIIRLLYGPNKPKSYDSVCSLDITNEANVASSPLLHGIIHAIWEKNLHVFYFEQVDTIHRGCRDHMAQALWVLQKEGYTQSRIKVNTTKDRKTEKRQIYDVLAMFFKGQGELPVDAYIWQGYFPKYGRPSFTFPKTLDRRREIREALSKHPGQV